MNPWPLLLALVVFVSGVIVGDRWKAGIDARIELKHLAAQKEQSDKIIADTRAIAKGYSDRYDAQSEELTNVRLQLANLPRNVACLDARTVRVLNSIGSVSRVGTASPAIAPASAAAAGNQVGYSGSGLKLPAASIAEVGDALAVCRGGYVKLSNQLNAILDIEDSREKVYSGK